MAPRFDYRRRDLHKPLADFLGGSGMGVEHFGVSNDEYARAEGAWADAIDSGKAIGDAFARRRGFRDLESLRRVFARCHLYIAYYYETLLAERQGEIMTVDRAMRFRYDKCAHLGILGTLAPPPANGNLLEYFESFSFAQLVAIGW